MSRIPFSLTAVAVAAGLAACATPEAVTSMRHVDSVVTDPSAAAGATRVVTTPGYAYLPGAGRIDSLTAVQRDGGSAWRAGVRMDDGSVRVVDTLTDGVMVGQRVYLDADGRLSLVNRDAVVAPAGSRSAATGGTSEPAYETRWVAPRAGLGRVENLSVVPNNAGFTAANGEKVFSVWRIGVRMDDGTTQVMDSPAVGLSVGKRVRITNEGNIVSAEG